MKRYTVTISPSQKRKQIEVNAHDLDSVRSLVAHLYPGWHVVNATQLLDGHDPEPDDQERTYCCLEDAFASEPH